MARTRYRTQGAGLKVNIHPRALGDIYLLRLQPGRGVEEDFDRSLGAQDGRWLLAEDLPSVISQRACRGLRGLCDLLRLGPGASDRPDRWRKRWPGRTGPIVIRSADTPMRCGPSRARLVRSRLITRGSARRITAYRNVSGGRRGPLDR